MPSSVPPTPDPARRPLPLNVRVLGLASLLNDVASEMIFPLLPAFLLGSLGATRTQLGLIEGTADSAASLLKLWSGGRSDRAQRRKGFVVFGYGLAALARPLIGLVRAPWQVLAIRTADRVGKGVRSAPRDALIADSTDPAIRGRAFGFHRAMDHLGAAVGPLLAMAFLWLWPDQLRVLFLLSAVPGLLVLALLVFALRETPTATPPQAVPTLTLAPFGPTFRLYLLALGLFTLGNSSDAFLLVRAGELGVAPKMLPLLWCVFHVAKSGGSLLAGRVIDRLGPRRPLALGWLVYAGVYLAFALADRAWHAWAVFLVYAVSQALSEPAEKTLVAQLAGTHRGLAFGWFNFVMGIAALPASWLFGLLYQRWGALAAFGFGAGLALLAAVLLLPIRPKAGAAGPGPAT